MNKEDFAKFALEFTSLSNEPTIDIKISPLSAWCLISQLQLALRHEQNIGITAHHARHIADALESRLELSEGMRSIIDMGWSKEHDVETSETLESFLSRDTQNSVPASIVEVYNAYALYQSEDNESEGTIQISRPQNWADKSEWTHERFKFEWLSDEKHYINNAYCWYNPTQLEKWKVPQAFGGAITMILMPGSKEELCGSSYLGDEDFWDDEWGIKPPVYFPSCEDEEFNELVD